MLHVFFVFLTVSSILSLLIYFLAQNLTLMSAKKLQGVSMK